MRSVATLILSTLFCAAFGQIEFPRRSSVDVVAGPLNVRIGPGLEAEVVGTMPEGGSGSVISGPVEQDGILWYLVYFSGGPNGWAAQGADGTIFLELSSEQPEPIDEVGVSYTTQIPFFMRFPMMAETLSCDAERRMRTHFPDIWYIYDRAVELIRTSGYGRNASCYLFRDVHGLEARRLIAEVTKSIDDLASNNGIPSWDSYFGIDTVISANSDAVSVTFSGESLLGVLAFELQHPDGLLMIVYFVQPRLEP